MGVGASTCASGSHVWNGNTGTLMANPMKSPTKRIVRTRSLPGKSCVWWARIAGIENAHSPFAASTIGAIWK